MTSILVIEQPAHRVPGDSELKHVLEEVAAAKEAARSTLLAYNLRMSKMSQDLNEHNADLNKQISDLMVEINTLQTKIREDIAKNAEKREPDDLDREFHEESNRANQEQSWQDFSPEPTQANESPELKKLFRKIAARTHPDRTDDPELNALFVTAKECRLSGDLEGLKSIWEFISGRASAMLSKLLRLIEAERQELRLIQMQLEAFRHSPDYALLSLYERDKNSVYLAIRQQAEQRRASLIAHLRMLQQSTGEYKQPTSYVTFTFA